MEKELKREIILSHYENPFNKKEVELKGYIKINANIETCIDNIDLYVLFDKDIIKDIYFNGEACAISTASTSILLKNIIGKTKVEAHKYMKNFLNMIEEKKYDKDLLNEGQVFDEISKQRSRIKCATLPYEALLNILKEEEK
jgi:nitrogen fixation NifU-like protein